MRSLTTMFLVALLGATLLAATASREPFALRLIRVEAVRAAPEMTHLLTSEPLAVNAVVAQYADRPVLRLHTHLALLRYPAMAREILPLYAGESEFQDAFESYGPAMLLPISYFMEHEVDSLILMRAAGDAVRGAKRAAERLLGVTGEEGAEAVRPRRADTWGVLTPVERGWYAVEFVRKEGYDFLGQFIVGADERVEWVQTERITEIATAFFSAGIRGLETKVRLNEDISPTDYLWAGVDLTLTAGAVKVLRAGRAASAAVRAGSRSGAQSALVARTVMHGGNAALRVGRYGVPVAVAYAVLRHPSLVSGLAAQAATALGWSVPVVQAAVWFIVLLPLLIVLRFLTRWLVRPALALLAVATRGVLWMGRSAPASPRTDSVHDDARAEPRLGDLSLPAEPDTEVLRTACDLKSPDAGNSR